MTGSPTPSIRAYRDEDHDQVVSLWTRAFPNALARNDPVLDIRRKLGVQRELFLVAAEGDSVLGTTMAGYEGHRGWLHLVAVTPEARGRGVGARLVREAERRLTELGCPKLNLQILESNRQVVGFYERLGFRVERRVSMGRVLPPGEVADGSRTDHRN